MEFEGTASGGAIGGHAALDDISYTPGERCSTNTGGVCDFQVGLCSWENQGDGSDDSDWMVSRNGTGNPGSGPRCVIVKINFNILLQLGPYIWNRFWQLPSHGWIAHGEWAKGHPKKSFDTGPSSS